MILESRCYACNRIFPTFLWRLHRWWTGCPGKTAAQHDRENGLIAGVPIEEWKKFMWPAPLSRACRNANCHGGKIINGMEVSECPTCAAWRPSLEERYERFQEVSKYAAPS